MPSSETEHPLLNTLSAPCTRRLFLKYALTGAFVTGLPFVPFPGASAMAATAKGESVLILYFSHSGNTRRIAEQIQKNIGGDLLEIQPASPYPSNYDAVVEQAGQEQKARARPAILTEIPNLDSYRTVFIGFPNWWGTMPMPCFTLLEKYDLGDRTVVPFCTHEGSRFGHSLRDLKRLCPHAHILEGLEIRGSRTAQAQENVKAWLHKLGLSAG